MREGGPTHRQTSEAAWQAYRQADEYKRTRILVSPNSKNPKTGDIPQIMIGGSKAEGLDSCKGCPMLSKKMGGKGEKTKCYHWGGSSQMGHISMAKANDKDPDKLREDLSYQLSSPKVSRQAQYVRLAVGGDPSALGRERVEEITETVKGHNFKGALGYTHFYRGRGSDLKGLVMASVESLEDADRAVDGGWRAAVVLDAVHPDLALSRAKRFDGAPLWTGQDFTTPKGRRVTVCPSQAGATVKDARGNPRPIDCNTCGMCDATQNKGGDIIGFLKH